MFGVQKATNTVGGWKRGTSPPIGSCQADTIRQRPKDLETGAGDLETGAREQAAGTREQAAEEGNRGVATQFHQLLEAAKLRWLGWTSAKAMQKSQESQQAQSRRATRSPRSLPEAG